jgi:putative hydrolase of the HAD superfamily
MGIRLILFDCMETVVDVIKEPDFNDYAWWAYNGCGYENYWDGFESFCHEYSHAKKEIESTIKQYEEYNMVDRFKLMTKRMDLREQTAQKIVTALSDNYWVNYKSNCYVDISVKSTLAELSKKYNCGIVSNFMVYGGIEELLYDHGVSQYFSFVVTSIKVGWRKPHPAIYDAAVELAQLPKNEVLFVGDNYQCDYKGPIEYGFNAIHLDKKDIGKAETRITALRELTEVLL